MKHAKRIAAITAGLAIAFTMSMTAFAADDGATTIAKKDYGSLKVSYSEFVEGSYSYGTYPQVDGADSLNSKIAGDLKNFFAGSKASALDADDNVTGGTVTSSITDDSGQFSKIDVVAVTDPSTPNHEEKTFSYYVDKSTGSEISQDAYEAGIAAASEDTEEEGGNSSDQTPGDASGLTDDQIKTILSTLVPIRATAESVGYSVAWDQDLQAVRVYDKDTTLVAIAFVGETAYLAGDSSVDLGIAPVNKDGAVQVPAAFFNSIIGLDVNVGDDGSLSFSVPASAPKTADTTTDTTTDTTASAE